MKQIKSCGQTAAVSGYHEREALVAEQDAADLAVGRLDRTMRTHHGEGYENLCARWRTLQRVADVIASAITAHDKAHES